MEQNPTIQIQNIALSDIYTFPGGTPYAYDTPETMRPLLNSIRKEGILRPVLLVKREEGGYYLIDGHRRCYAAYMTHQTSVPAYVQELSIQDRQRIMANANLPGGTKQLPEHTAGRQALPEKKSSSIISCLKQFLKRFQKRKKEKGPPQERRR